MPTPPSLWTDRPDHWLDAPATEPAATAARPQPVPDSSPIRRRSRRLPTAFATLALLGAGGAGGILLTDEDAPATSATAATTLPAANGQIPTTSVGEIYAKASRAVVSVEVRRGNGGGSGTGFLIDSDGTLVTNAHVVSGAETVQIRFDDDGQAVEAEVVGADVSTDLAVLQVDASAIPEGVEPLRLASSADVEVGDAAIAIGYPLGLERTATSGIISGVGRQIEAPNGFSIDDVIQTDAPINPGNSGGPLLDAAGRVIGVNSQIATAGAGGGNVGIGFAVPSDTVREVVPQLESGESIERAYLGIATGPATSGTGATVGSVTSGSPAQQAGIRTGDVVVEADGEEVGEPDDIASAIADDEPGERIELGIRRNGQLQTVTVTLGTRPGASP